MSYANTVANAATRRRPAKFGNQGSMQGAAEDAYNTEAGYGSDATAAYLEKAKSFDPSQAIQTYAQGAWGSISDGLKRQIATTQGQEVGAGRFDSGFNDEDVQGVYRTATDQLTNSLAQQAVAASGQTLQNNSQLGQFAQSTTQDANDLLASEREYQYNADEQKKKNKSAKGAAIGGAIGAIGGSFIPGIGTMVGGTIGSALGGLF